MSCFVDCVLKSASDADRARILELEASENSLKVENSHLKQVADVALTQASAVEGQKVSQEKELLSLRQQLIDIQSQSDEKKVIGQCLISSLVSRLLDSLMFVQQESVSEKSLATSKNRQWIQFWDLLQL